jgi:NADH:ubiquinone oxidoreductase subunit 3 (subunit A)
MLISSSGSTEAVCTFEEFAIAFTFIFIASTFIYVLGRLFSPKPSQQKQRGSSYACGEKPFLQVLRINVSLYRYLIYFVILDSSVLLVAFASLASGAVSILAVLLYLATVFVATLLLMGGSE